jgi:FkbM family methyltransferase
LSHFVDLTALFGRPEEAKVAEVIKALHPGAVFVDAGAHIGRYSLMAADRVGETGVVLAIEPDAGNFSLLCENMSLNRLTCIRARNLALGRENGTAELTCADDSATNTLYPEWLSILQPGDNSSTRPHQTVTVRRLDTLLQEEQLEKADLLKIDVEGAEMDVLEGARESLERRRIRAILCEVHQPIVQLFDLVIYLGRLGYKVEDLGHSEIYAHF